MSVLGGRGLLRKRAAGAELLLGGRGLLRKRAGGCRCWAGAACCASAPVMSVLGGRGLLCKRAGDVGAGRARLAAQARRDSLMGLRKAWRAKAE